MPGPFHVVAALHVGSARPLTDDGCSFSPGKAWSKADRVRGATVDAGGTVDAPMFAVLLGRKDGVKRRMDLSTPDEAKVKDHVARGNAALGRETSGFEYTSQVVDDATSNDPGP